MSESVLILEPEDYSGEAIEIYDRLGEVAFYSPEGDLSSVTVLVVRLGFHLNGSFLESFPSLRYIVSPTTGLNHIDLDYCKKSDVRVLSLKGETDFLETITSTAEMTIALVLALIRNIRPGAEDVSRGNWNRDLFKGRQLKSLTMGIIGHGRVGKQLAGFAGAFGMRVLLADREPREMDHFVSLEVLLEQSDIVCLTANYTEENRGMIGHREFALMRDGSYFVNTARGELVDEMALLKCLKEGKFSGVGLDVLHDEHSLSENPILQFYRQAGDRGNLVITPHVSGCTADAMEETEVFMATKLEKQLTARRDS